MWTAQTISEQSRQEFGVPTTLPAFYFDCTEWDQGTAGFVGQCFLTLVTLHDALSRAIIWGQVVVVVVGFPGPIDLRLMLVADKTSLPAELYNTWIQSAPGSELATCLGWAQSPCTESCQCNMLQVLGDNHSLFDVTPPCETRTMFQDTLWTMHRLD